MPPLYTQIYRGQRGEAVFGEGLTMPECDFWMATGQTIPESAIVFTLQAYDTLTREAFRQWAASQFGAAPPGTMLPGPQHPASPEELAIIMGRPQVLVTAAFVAPVVPGTAVISPATVSFVNSATEPDTRDTSVNNNQTVPASSPVDLLLSFFGVGSDATPAVGVSAPPDVPLPVDRPTPDAVSTQPLSPVLLALLLVGAALAMG